MAKNKPTSEMGSRKLANIINDELKLIIKIKFY